MPTITVLDANSDPQDIEIPNSNGRRSAALSRPVVLSTEDQALIDALVDLLTDGPAVTELQTIRTRLNGVLDIRSAEPLDIAGSIDCIIDETTYPGWKPGTNVTVVDGSARVTRVPRHVTSTGSALTAAAANANRTYLEVRNSSDTDQWYRYDGTAAIGGAGSILLKPGEYDIWDGARICPTGAISVVCGTSGKNMSVWEG